MADAVSQRREEAALVAALAGGDSSALSKLYDLHAGAMIRAARRFFQSPQDAEDLLHDVFVEAWQHASDFNAGRGSVRSWLLTRIRSRAIDRLRSLDVARRHAMAETHAAESQPTLSSPEWAGPDAERAKTALDSLPAEQRLLVELGYFEGLTYSEMATHCGIPIGTVRSRLSAAIQKLRRAFDCAPESK